MRFTRQEYIELMTFGDFERVMFCELFGPLIGLPEEWKSQGARNEEIEMVGFDWDYVPYAECGAVLGAFGTPEGQVLEDNEEYRIERDYLGRTTKLCKKTATLPLPMDYPVSRPEDWQKVKQYFEYREDRVDDAAVEKAAELQKQGYVIRGEMPGAWDILRELMGEERACLAMFDWPDVVNDIFGTIADTCVKCLERVTDKVAVDQLYTHEDMAGKAGPLVGPGQVLEFFKPYYLAVWEVVSGRGTRLFNQDSDGDMRPLIDAFLECGVNVMHPFEPNAGMDVVETRKKYGEKLAMLGGIDKFVLFKDKEDIRKELEYKMQPMMRETGGMIFSLDHRIPNGVPLENYRFYVSLGREILGLEPLDGTRKGWGRMAF